MRKREKAEYDRCQESVQWLSGNGRRCSFLGIDKQVLRDNIVREKI